MQPITMSLGKSKILRNMSWRFQKDNRKIKCGCNSNNFMLNVRNYSKSIFVAPRLRAPERPMLQPRDQVFWNTALLDIELNNFLLPNNTGTRGLLQRWRSETENKLAPQARLGSTSSSRLTL